MALSGDPLAARPASVAEPPEIPALLVRELGPADNWELSTAAWQDLAENALESNAFYEPWLLRPALQEFGTQDGATLIAIFRPQQNPTRPGELVGLFPVVKKRRYRGLPLRLLSLWKHVHCFLCTPLIRRDAGPETLQALFRWAKTRASAFEFNFVHGEGPFQHLLVRQIHAWGLVQFIEEQFSRALLLRRTNFETYTQGILTGAKRSELRRLRKKLGELGHLESRVLQDSSELETWIENFLELEARGWKGQEGTALKACDSERRFFQAAAREGFARKKLLMLGLFRDGKPIALKCNFAAGPGAFTFKIAFDEAYSKFSPGVLLELDNIEYLHRRPEMTWMDSCAVPEHFMINRLWQDRRLIQSSAVALRKASGGLVLGLLPLLRSLRRLVRPLRF